MDVDSGDEADESNKENEAPTRSNPFVRGGRLTWALQPVSSSESDSQVGPLLSSHVAWDTDSDLSAEDVDRCPAGHTIPRGQYVSDVFLG